VQTCSNIQVVEMRVGKWVLFMQCIFYEAERLGAGVAVTTYSG